MTDLEHTLQQLPERPGTDQKVKYYVVDNITVTSTPASSGVLANVVAAESTPEWIRRLFRTGEVD